MPIIPIEKENNSIAANASGAADSSINKSNTSDINKRLDDVEYWEDYYNSSPDEKGNRWTPWAETPILHDTYKWKKELEDQGKIAPYEENKNIYKLKPEDKPITIFNPWETTLKNYEGTKDKPLRIYNKTEKRYVNWESTLENYRRNENVKSVDKYFNPDALTITDFTNNAEVKERAAEMMGYIYEKEYADGTNAADDFIDYARGPDFNVTKSMYRMAKLAALDKDDPKAQKFLENYGWLLNEFWSTHPNGKYKYENVGLSENLTLTGDIFKGIFSDAFNWAAVFLTAGTTLPEKIAIQQGVNLTNRQLIKNMAARSYNVTLGKAAPTLNKIPKIPINPKSYTSTMNVLGLEGALYSGIDSHLMQRRWNTIGVDGYEEYDPRLTLMSIPIGYTFGGVFGAGTTKYVRYRDKSKANQEAITQARESKKFEDTVLGNPEGNPDARIITVEEAAQINREIRDNTNNPTPTHVEEVADFERRAANEEHILKDDVVDVEIVDDGVIITDKTVSQVLKEDSKAGKPTVGGLWKVYEEGYLTTRLFQKPTTKSKQLGEISKELEEAGVDQGGTAYQLLRLLRNDSLERMRDDPVVVAYDKDYGIRQYSEQVSDLAGSWSRRLEDFKYNIQKIASKEKVYQHRTGTFRLKKDWELKNGTRLNDDLYLFLNNGRFKADVPESIVKEAAKLRKLFDDIERVAIQEGFVFNKVPNFFPRHLKLSKLQRAQGGVRRYAQQLVDDGEIDNINEAMKAVHVQMNKIHDDLDPSVGSLGQREYINLDTYAIKEFFDNDVFAQTWLYINTTSKKIINKRTVGLTDTEQNNKWWYPIFGGTIQKTSVQDGLETVREHLLARGLSKELVYNKNLSKYIKSNFLARQNNNEKALMPKKDIEGNFVKNEKGVQVMEEVSIPFNDLIKGNARLRSNNTIVNNDPTFKKLTIEEKNQLLNNTFQEEIDYIILNSFNNDTFSKISRKLDGELSENNVNYRGNLRTLKTEENRLRTLVGSMTGVWGRGSKFKETWTGAALAAQAGNKLGMATLSSLPELFIPIFKANVKVGVQALFKTSWEEGSEAAKNLVRQHKMPTLTRKEMQQHNKIMSSALSEAVSAAYGEGLTGLSAKFTYRFYRTIVLDQYTKFVQMYSYNAGKLLIRENLEKLSKMGDEAFNKNNSKAVRLRSQINQLGVDVDAGIKWHKTGGKIEEPFYENLKSSADRFVNEVVMVPNRENAQKFLASNHWAGRVAFQLYSYPVAFGNTIVRNAFRDMTMTRGAAVPRHLAVGSLMYYTTSFTQTLKTRGRSDERDPRDQMWYVLNTIGLGGPLALPYNMSESVEYGSNTPKAALRLMGPTVGGMFLQTLETGTPGVAAFKNTVPYRNLIKTLAPEQLFELEEFLKDIERRRYVTQLIGVPPEGERTRRKKYKEAVKKFQEEQKRGAQIRRRDKKKKEQREKKLSKATGGLVSKKYPVPFVKDNPSERKIDNTNQSFAVVSGLFEEEDRVPFSLGGKLANKIIRTNLFKKKAGWKWTKAPKGFDKNPDGQFPLVSVETGGKHFYSLQADFPEGVLLERYAKNKSEPRLRPTTKGVIRKGNKVGEIKTSSGKVHPVYDNIVAVDKDTKAVKGLKDMPKTVMPAPQRFFDPEDKGYKPFLSEFDYEEGGRYVELSEKGKKDITGVIPKQARISISPKGKASFTISKEFYESLFAETSTKSSKKKSLLDKDVDTSYKMQHQASSVEEGGARLDDMTGGGTVFPDDIYSPQGLRYYGNPNNKFDRESYEIIQKAKGKPNMEITIYRAVPKDDSIKTINEGDWVTLSKTYAEMHGESGYGRSGDEAGKIISKKVKVKDLVSDGNDLNEFGYFPSRIRKSRGGNAKSLTKKDKAFLYGRWLPVDKEKHTSISEEVLSERKKQRELRQKRTEERNKRLEKIKKKSLVFLKQKKDKEKIEKEKDMKDDTVWESLVRLHNQPR